MGNIISRDRSIIPACDVSLDVYKNILRGTCNNEKVGAYKIGPALTGRLGYDEIVRITRECTDKPLIFDAQKWGTDIPETAEPLLRPLKESGIDVVILFPQAGPITEYKWIKTAKNLGLGVIVGGYMTHSGYREGDKISSDETDYGRIFQDELGMELPTGFIRRSAPIDMYRIAAKMGIIDFVVPGNQIDVITEVRNMIEKEIGFKDASYFAPGFIAQGGEISESAKVAGEKFHAIVGRGILSNGHGPIVIKQTVDKLTKNL